MAGPEVTVTYEEIVTEINRRNPMLVELAVTTLRANKMEALLAEPEMKSAVAPVPDLDVEEDVS